jgi:hypothetical protein
MVCSRDHDSSHSFLLRTLLELAHEFASDSAASTWLRHDERRDLSSWSVFVDHRENVQRSKPNHSTLVNCDKHGTVVAMKQDIKTPHNRSGVCRVAQLIE